MGTPEPTHHNTLERMGAWLRRCERAYKFTVPLQHPYTGAPTKSRLHLAYFAEDFLGKATPLLHAHLQWRPGAEDIGLRISYLPKGMPALVDYNNLENIKFFNPSAAHVLMVHGQLKLHGEKKSQTSLYLHQSLTLFANATRQPDENLPNNNGNYAALLEWRQKNLSISSGVVLRDGVNQPERATVQERAWFSNTNIPLFEKQKQHWGLNLSTEIGERSQSNWDHQKTYAMLGAHLRFRHTDWPVSPSFGVRHHTLSGARVDVGFDIGMENVERILTGIFKPTRER